jgi:hypothetical protein
MEDLGDHSPLLIILSLKTLDVPSMEAPAVCAVALSCRKYLIFFLQLTVDERRNLVYCSYTNASSQLDEKVSG